MSFICSHFNAGLVNGMGRPGFVPVQLPPQTLDLFSAVGLKMVLSGAVDKRMT